MKIISKETFNAFLMGLTTGLIMQQTNYSLMDYQYWFLVSVILVILIAFEKLFVKD